jgi:hypothetical protein
MALSPAAPSPCGGRADATADGVDAGVAVAAAVLAVGLLEGGSAAADDESVVACAVGAAAWAGGA